MTYRATVAHPCIDSGHAVAALRGRLRELAARSGAPAIEWSTLRIAGPEEVVGAGGRVRYEWVATVEPVGSAGRPPVPVGRDGGGAPHSA